MTLDGNTIIVLALVGLALLCLVGFLFVAVLVFRFARLGVLPLLGSLREQVNDLEDDPRYAPKPHADLRSIAQQHDFNAALAQQVIEKQLEPPPPAPITPQNAPYVPDAATSTPDEPRFHTPPPTFVPPTPRFGQRRADEQRRRDEGRRRDHDDEVFGGLLDIDGDADPDL